MSYPFHSLNRVSAGRTVCSEIGFSGLDVAGGAFKNPISCAFDTENLIWEGSALKRRPGYRWISSFSQKINGIFYVGDQRIVHVGTKLYLEREQGFPKLLFGQMNDAASVGVVRKQEVEHRWCNASEMYGWSRQRKSGDFLFINDGKNYLFFDGEQVHAIADTHWGESLRNDLYDGMVYSTYAKVPISITGKLPNGDHGDVDPRGDNRLSQFRCESFYVDDKQDYTEFILDRYYKDCNEGIPTEIQIRDSNGVWRNYCCISADFYLNYDDVRTKLKIDTPIKGGMPFSFDTANGKIVNLGYGSSYIANDGMDNLRITYAVYKDAPTALTGATVQGTYGTDGADDVLFLGGSEEAPGIDAFSARNDFFCFYATSVERLGDEKTFVTGYARLNDGRIAVLKNDPNDSNVYFRTHKTVSVGVTQSGEEYQVDAFPSKAGAAVEGCVSPHSVGIAGNEPIFLAESGLYSVRSVSNELINLDETVRRSLPIDPLLCKQNAASARSIRWRQYYLLVFGTLAVITDGRRDSNGMLHFLKWRFAHKITALGKNGNTLYLGDETGNTFEFGGADRDADLEMTSFWQTNLPEDSRGCRQILKQLSVAVSPDYEGEITAVLYREQTPMPQEALAMNRVDFSALDFAHFTFDGTDSMRWVQLPVTPSAADRYAVRIELCSGQELLLWGLRMVYEKGGTVR
ncbi:MAG: hypothetical protein IJO92_02795 [Clostridia bacterium]|nr:hypothetical protein [Clostridia bacterium]